MTFEAHTLATLSADSAISEKVGDRIFFINGSQDVPAPFITLRRISTDPTLSTDNGQSGSSELDNIRLEANCLAKTSEEANTLAVLIRRCLERARPTTYIFQDRLSDYSDLPDLFNTVLEFSCWHPDTIPLDPEP
jgi:hypothetical protein